MKYTNIVISNIRRSPEIRELEPKGQNYTYDKNNTYQTIRQISPGYGPTSKYSVSEQHSERNP